LCDIAVVEPGWVKPGTIPTHGVTNFRQSNSPQLAEIKRIDAENRHDDDYGDEEP
jgi:hypothetical protein